jgi:hypothetical protein
VKVKPLSDLGEIQKNKLSERSKKYETVFPVQGFNSQQLTVGKV